VHPSLGASWEGFALEELIKARDWRAEDCYFWAVHGQCELDLVIADGQRLHGFEIKHTLEPKVTKSMMTAVTTLGLEKLTVIYPGEDRRPLGKGVEAVPLAMLI
jgi:predicted AAA+ superfamily ATPase